METARIERKCADAVVIRTEVYGNSLDILMQSQGEKEVM